MLKVTILHIIECNFCNVNGGSGKKRVFVVTAHEELNVVSRGCECGIKGADPMVMKINRSL